MAISVRLINVFLKQYFILPLSVVCIIDMPVGLVSDDLYYAVVYNFSMYVVSTKAYLGETAFGPFKNLPSSRSTSLWKTYLGTV